MIASASHLTASLVARNSRIQRTMKFRFVVILLFAMSVEASPMYRVTGIAGPSTIVVDRDGIRSEVVLTGIEITDPRNAVGFLSWSLGSSWVMVEDGQVYRSPDGLLINAELVKKGFARFADGTAPTAHSAVYLGELDLGPRPAVRAPARAPAPRARAARPSPVLRRAIRPRTTRALLR